MKSILLGVSLLLLSNCAGYQEFDQKTPTYGRSIIAGWQSINYAWGFSQQSFFINDAGEIISASADEGDSVGGIAGKEDISGLEMGRLLAHGALAEYRVSSEDLQIMRLLLDDAESGSMSDPVTLGADQGTQQWVVFVRRGDGYHRVILKQEGDRQFHNLSDSAGRLVALIDKWRNPQANQPPPIHED